MNKYFYTVVLAWVCITIAHARETQSINDDWEFIRSNCETKDAFASSSGGLKWESVTLPHTWNSKDAQSGGQYYKGVGCYRKLITIPASHKGKRVFLRFEGVGQVADVYVNGLHVGHHKGAYAAFCFEITKALKFGEANQVFVRADNTIRKDIIPINHNLFTVFGGIYRPVSMIVTDPINISPTDYASPGVYIRQKHVSKKQAQIQVKSKLTNAHPDGQEVTVKTTVIDKDGREVSRASKSVDLRSTTLTAVDQVMTIENPTLWHGRRNPYLYQVKVDLIQNEKVIDQVIQPLGLRFFRMDAEQGFILNGEPYRLYGVCRHQEWKDDGSALSADQHRIDSELMYEMGCTSLRLAHYQQADDMYAHGDRLGFVIWAEIPFVNTWNGAEGDNAKQQMLELIRQNYNHPSICIWGLHNEVYAKHDNQFPVLLTKDLHNLAKSEDPDRFTVSTSGFGSLTRFMDCHADLMGSNRYFGWYYGKSDEIGAWADGTRKVRPDNPVCVAEYGCGGNIAHQKYKPKQPAAAGDFFPEQYQSLQHEIQWRQMQPRPFIWGAYIWNMFDFNVAGWSRGGIKGLNHKGLISYDRKQKKDAFFFYKANWSEEPVLHLSGKRLGVIGEKTMEIKAYSNCEKVELHLNGKRISSIPGDDVKVFLWSDMQLKPGENTIEVTASYKGKKLQDLCKLVYDPELKAREAAKKRELLVADFDVALASEEDQNNIAQYAADGNLKTHWSARTKGSWLRLDLNKQRNLDGLSIQWFKGDQRKYQFSIAYSTDGNSWIEVFDGKSSGQSKGPEYFAFTESVKTRYIRIKGQGSNVTEWTNIVEVQLPEKP
ncbi:discoidin domain-containing protein [Verrucomicrobiaceae bacterium N1E253]|uniref:Discoidin domain-containing protein n=1 Tax=Oceaniferula marina TaxID=2748318 RepID=A0A851GH65_9BACT|nr:discoidin domain-containing protein [Oceaniferula marina]NWK54467.1 discoidin domain-containing protein [Oceaniferula marina]